MELNKIYNKLFILFIILFIILISLIQYHEIQHYNDFKDLDCKNISYQFVRVQAECPFDKLNKAQELVDLRDEQFLNLLLLSALHE